MWSSMSALVAFLGTTSAALSGAPAYILQQHPQQASAALLVSQNTPPAVNVQTARLILEQRLNTPNVFLSDGIDEASRETAISAINAFGRAPKPLFGEPSAYASDVDSQSTGVQLDASQLVVLVEGLSDAEIEQTAQLAGLKTAFTVSDPPSSMANSVLVREHPAANAGKKCELSEAVNPLSAACWHGTSSLLRFDAKKDATLLSTLQSVIPKLAGLASSGEMESVFVFFPESARSSKLNSWDTAATELRRRQAEEAVMTDKIQPTNETPKTNLAGTSAKPAPGALFVSSKDVPECFKDAEACSNGTNSCSGNGICVNRWGKDVGEACFVCNCVSVKEGGKRSTTGYAGKACEKLDYSTPFALFVGFSIAMVGILAFSISLLFQVGEEPLPGVLGAGVAKK
ncbi:hypothetical protein Cpir12675_002119 [Ceratocystis pirilliformis]|uniref:Vacuolar sorting protein Vps3844 C-terminal domain-containing protein n=1 Tax=Ceratocystis pirilliformis TaxID=259994 RepID=A0ABR3ZD02_9PEZI